MYRSLIALAATALIAGGAFAESEQDNEPHREHRGPPPAALEVCSNLVQGDSCAFDGNRGDTLQGTCEAPEDKPLACRPEGGPPKNQMELR